MHLHQHQLWMGPRVHVLSWCGWMRVPVQKCCQWTSCSSCAQPFCRPAAHSKEGTGLTVPAFIQVAHPCHVCSSPARHYSTCAGLAIYMAWLFIWHVPCVGAAPAVHKAGIGQESVIEHSKFIVAIGSWYSQGKTSVPTLDLGRVPTVNSLGRFGKFSLHK